MRFGEEKREYIVMLFVRKSLIKVSLRKEKNVIGKRGFHPSGSNILCHIYKIKEIKNIVFCRQLNLISMRCHSHYLFNAMNNEQLTMNMILLSVIFCLKLSPLSP